MDAGGRATQEQLPSLHKVNEHFLRGTPSSKFNDARASKVVFQRFLRKINAIVGWVELGETQQFHTKK